MAMKNPAFYKAKALPAEALTRTLRSPEQELWAS